MALDRTSFPQYYMVDDIPVRLYIGKGEMVYAVNDLNKPWDLKKVMIEGNQISKEQYDEECRQRKIYLSKL